ncbi:MAG TPA: hypothetical protein VHD83_05950 [Puia sp.]|nr:hypothetical protein [Puia sp.]
MREKIKEFIYVDNPSFSSLENMVMHNRSNHDDPVHQALFYAIDGFAKRVVRDLHNTNGDTLFRSNQLNIVSDEATIKNVIEAGVKNMGYKTGALNNPEMIYRAFNFARPANLLPNYITKLYLIKQKGLSASGVETNYVLNPYFFGFKISLDIFLTNLFCGNYYEGLETGLVKILTDKYGMEYKDLYENVSYVAAHGARESKRKGEENDTSFIDHIQSISGIESRDIFFRFIYESGMITSQQRAKAFTR